MYPFCLLWAGEKKQKSRKELLPHVHGGASGHQFAKIFKSSANWGASNPNIKEKENQKSHLQLNAIPTPARPKHRAKAMYQADPPSPSSLFSPDCFFVVFESDKVSRAFNCKISISSSLRNCRWENNFDDSLKNKVVRLSFSMLISEAFFSASLARF